ncbi:MAG TPA: UDP-N-acetylmuramoyl-tripeptide--D-alanyl-D-alanine ligase [Tepidisphaeraceae bacterium]|jgi:UDP-N-acetylmuramoyl-tripeptide--D-alanyl-D-alanine ligase|nr:UDP-N-acetylmuramoyl-tripeptide--D-alanyl-D-alanine ligase [Tepidisphaeraceae bacterium]
MKPLSIQDIKRAISGRSLSVIPEVTPFVKSICTDTRRIEPGCLFIAIKGDKFDAHEFLADAAKSGAIAALVEKPPATPIANFHLIGVLSTRRAMGKLAMHVRKQMRAKVIAVAGSNGKTSTKHLIDAALSAKLKGSISPKSFNNDIGVPLAIFPADPSQDYLVLEIGTNHFGEIKNLSDIALPDIAVITNCGAEHLEFLRDLNGVRRENAEIVSGMTAKGTLIVNGDDPDLLKEIESFPGQKITFGLNETNDLFASNIECDQTGVRFSLNKSRRRVFVPMLGKHNACNALAALAVARRMGVNEEQAIESLATAHGPEMRMQLQSIGPITLINDAYNANPSSMRAALQTLAALQSPGRHIAILGDMLELGSTSDRYHREMGQVAAQCKLDLLVCVGHQAALIAEEAGTAGLPNDRILRFNDSTEATRGVPVRLKDGDLILLKGSRSMRLEAIDEAIRKHHDASSIKVAS